MRPLLVFFAVLVSGCNIPVPAGSSARKEGSKAAVGGGDILKHRFWEEPPTAKEWSALLDKAADSRAYGAIWVNRKGGIGHVDTVRGLDLFTSGDFAVGIDLDALKAEGPITRSRAEEAFRHAMDELMTKEDYRKGFK